MAGIGHYGVFYSKCVKTEGVTTGYTGGVKMMGKAISAAFEPNTPDDNPLYANNGIAENDISSGSGGTLTQTLDRMTLEVAADLYGTTVEEVSVQVGEETITGTEITYKGNEVSAPVGVGYINLVQESGIRVHEVVFYREVSYSRPNESAATMGESIEWQTPEVSGIVAGLQGDGSKPWYRVSRWPTQEAAIKYIYHLLGAELDDDGVATVAETLNSGDDDEDVTV